MPAGFAVIIPHFNDASRLRRCLDALAVQDLTNTEVVVVDNATPGDIGGVVADYPFARLIVEHRKGAANARNRGVAETAAPYLFFLDCDCVPAPDWLASAKASCQGADIVGGAIDVFDETAPPRTAAQAFETVFAFNYRDYILNKGFSVTANLLTRRDVFEAAGPFIDGVSEDAEWCHRAVGKGYALVLDESLRVAHPTRRDWSELRRKWSRINRETFALELSRGPAAKVRLRWAMRAFAMPFSIAAHVPRILRHPGLHGTRERLLAAGCLVRLRITRMGWMLRQAATGRTEA